MYDLDWIIADDTVLRPDIMIVCDELKSDFLTFPPSLIVEILSPSTAMKDRTVKYEIYQQQKVKYYLLADPALNTIKIFVLGDNGYEEKVTDKFNLNGKCEITVDMLSLFKSE